MQILGDKQPFDYELKGHSRLELRPSHLVTLLHSTFE
jgi:hypothetical protein